MNVLFITAPGVLGMAEISPMNWCQRLGGKCAHCNSAETNGDLTSHKYIKHRGHAVKNNVILRTGKNIIPFGA